MGKIRRGSSNSTLLYILIFALIIAIVAVFVYHHTHQKQPTVAPASAQTSTFNHNTNPSNGNTLIYHGPKDFTGIYGTVTTNACPNVQSSTSCPPSYLKNIMVAATNTMNHEKLIAKSDSSGSYHITTGSGAFRMSAVSSSKSGFPDCTTSGTVQVAANQSQRFDIHCDSGVR